MRASAGQTPEPPTRFRLADRNYECEVSSSGRAATWMRVRGELDLDSAPQFDLALRESLASALLVIVDLRELTFIDSSGLHLIMEADARARRSGRRLVFVRAPAQIDRLFKLLGLSARLEIIDLRPILVTAPSLQASLPLDGAGSLDSRTTRSPSTELRGMRHPGSRPRFDPA
jgi:anti-sigma B factor antagonist